MGSLLMTFLKHLCHEVRPFQTSTSFELSNETSRLERVQLDIEAEPDAYIPLSLLTRDQQTGEITSNRSLDLNSDKTYSDAIELYLLVGDLI